MKNKLKMISTVCIAIAIGALTFGISMSYAEGVVNKAGDFSRGAKIWSENCTRCHNMRDPKEFNDELWGPIMTHMRLRAGFTGQEARDVLIFLRQSNTPTGAVVPKKKTVSSKVSVPMKDVLKGANVANGKAIFEESCFACHGDDGKGALAGIPDFTKENSVLNQSDDVLFKHVNEGFQTSGSPMAMPAKGGNEDLTSNDIKDVIAYIKQTFNE